MPDKEMIQVDQAMFETEAEQVAGAARYEPKEGRKAYRAGHYERSLTVRPAA